jgi:hypothetical protein
VEYRITLKYFIIILLCSIDEVCPEQRREFLDFKYKHNFVRDVLFNIFRHAGLSAKSKASVNFLTDKQEGRYRLSGGRM